MLLRNTHEGYEYQDLLGAYFIIKEILNETNSDFIVDYKTIGDDKFDDLTIRNANGVYKNQVKYSNADVNRTAVWKDFSSGILSLDELYNSWNSDPQKLSTKVRLCLAWNEPTDELKNFLKPINGNHSFTVHRTALYQFEIETFWPENSTPPQNWQRFVKASNNIDRKDFEPFLEHLEIEFKFPKFSMNVYSPGELESNLIEVLGRLGVGYSPNKDVSIEEFALRLISLVKQYRGLNTTLTAADILSKLKIQTNFGALSQEFPVEQNKNIDSNKFNENLIKKLEKKSKLLLIGEPGSGKSWAIDNFKKYIIGNGVRVIRHLCYTDLNDIHSIERIKLNTFYGNLIKDIIDNFPELLTQKNYRYASNLSELNLLINKITETTLIIIDGLDHINRIADFSKQNITAHDIAIIQKIKNIELPNCVKILVSSQPISDLQELTDFETVEIPAWDREDIVQYLEKLIVNDAKISGGDIRISDFLLKKSNGNPLYVNYLVQEIKNIDTLSLDNLDSLPDYSFNLENYYQHLTSGVEINRQIARIFSVCNFPLSKEELKEISFEGDNVDKHFSELMPVLKQNYVAFGYTIYHESFRRFILNEILSSNIDINRLVFEPIIHWFNSKGFYSHQKTFRYFLEFLLQCSRENEVAEHLTIDFVTKALLEGNSWRAIKNNFNNLSVAAFRLKDFPNIIVLNEINKIILGNEDTVNEEYKLYFEALGFIYGFDKVAESLSFENKATLNTDTGVDICYLCAEYGVTPPIQLYSQPLSKNSTIIDFSYFIKSKLLDRDKADLEDIAEKILTNKNAEAAETCQNELNNFYDAEFVAELLEEDTWIKKLYVYAGSIKTKNTLSIEEIADRILSIDHINDEIKNLLYELQKLVFENKNDKSFKRLAKEAIEKFSSKGTWFFDWLVYLIKIYLVDTNKDYAYEEIKKIYKDLELRATKFEGSPRACDLHSIHNLIYESIGYGLSLLKEEDNWGEIFSYIQSISDQTISYLFGSPGGPINTDEVFQLAHEKVPISQIHSVIDHLISIFELNSGSEIYVYNSRYSFYLSLLFSKIADRDNAFLYYKKGVEYLISYSSHKDMAASDLIDSMDTLEDFDDEEKNEYAQKMKLIVDSIVMHTDRDETRYYPIDWFKKILKLNFEHGLLYLAHSFKNTEFSWVLEESLIDAADFSAGKTDPVLELLLLNTMPIEASSQYIQCCIDLLNKVNSSEQELAKRTCCILYNRLSYGNTKALTNEQIIELNTLFTEFGIDTIRVEDIKKENFSEESKPISATTESEIKNLEIVDIAEYIKSSILNEPDIYYLKDLFENSDKLTSILKDIIQSLVIKDNSYNSKIHGIHNIFEKQNEIFLYYQVCRFVYDTDGWYHQLVNISAFVKAFGIDKDKSFEYLFELLSENFSIGYRNGFSSNLIKALRTIDFNKETIKQMWKNLYDSIDYRLPNKVSFDWNKALENDLGMNSTELMVCVLFSRFRTGTSERFSQTLSGICHLLEKDSNLLIKPLKWFIKNSDSFLDCVTFAVLSLLLMRNNTDVYYVKNFEEDLNLIYPKYYFLVDRIIELLLNKQSSSILTDNPSLIYDIPQGLYMHFVKSSFRHKELFARGVPLKNVFAKFINTWRSVFEDNAEMYTNQSYKIAAPNIYKPDYILKILNTDLRTALLEINNTVELIDFIGLSVNTLVAQCNSIAVRPLDLQKPSSLDSNTIEKPFNNKNDFIRLAHFEKEINDESGNLNQSMSFGGVIFGNVENVKYSLEDYYNPIEIWEGNFTNFSSEKLVYSLIQIDDDLEEYKILWLHDCFLKQFKLNIGNYNNGLRAKNEKDETILIFNSWKGDYLGYGHYYNPNDEIPKLDGSELLIRADYFEKLSFLFDNAPLYFVRKVELNTIMG